MTSWKIGGETMETVTDFIFLGSKVTASCDCCHKCKSSFLLGRKAMMNLDSILKSRDITLLTKIHVWMWEMDHKEGWVLKNWCLPIVVLEKTLESPLDCKEIKPVNLKGNQPAYSLKGLMLKLKFQYFGHLMWRADPLGKKKNKPWCWERLKAKGEEGSRVWDG